MPPLGAEARAALAEFMACMLFVYFGAGSVSAAFSATNNLGPIEPINYAASFGFGIVVLAFSTGEISGGHINPAVTLSMLVTGNLTPSRAAMYFVAQFTGGIAGGGLLLLSVGEDNFYSGIGLAKDVEPAGGFLLEFFGTLVLIFVIFNVAVWSGKPLENDLGANTVAALAPLPIGLTVFVSHLTLGPFTGCGINPARVLGAVIWEKEEWWDQEAGQNFWIYFVGPFLASIIGPLLYLALHGTLKPGSAGKEVQVPAA